MADSSGVGRAEVAVTDEEEAVAAVMAPGGTTVLNALPGDTSKAREANSTMRRRGDLMVAEGEDDKSRPTGSPLRRG